MGLILKAVNITLEGLDQEYERKKADSKEVWGLNKWKGELASRKFCIFEIKMESGVYLDRLIET